MSTSWEALFSQCFFPNNIPEDQLNVLISHELYWVCACGLSFNLFKSPEKIIFRRFKLMDVCYAT